MASVCLRGIRKSFDRQDVIKGIDLEIADGQFVVFVGPLGCGPWRNVFIFSREAKRAAARSEKEAIYS